ncbi:dTDP-glucose 4,6-dehydratase [Cohnella sp. GCM10012308]|uniref:dTDP-glucose 4,6-dehydratase n=1 Tax=Cohnella sp. GCM10012308 TaxID=3317329 RepID=UPI003612DD48
MKLLVTGGAGFIGSNFVHYMLNRYPNYQIINVDLLTYAGNMDNLSGVEGDARHSFFKADIADPIAMGQIFEQEIDAIINFAAESHVDRSIEQPEIFIHSNIQGTQNLLNLSLKHKVKKYIQVSTDEVYGTLGDEGLFTESSPIAPNSPYSATKAGADLLVRAYHETYSLSVNITRCSNNYGPFQFPEKLIPLMIQNALSDNFLPVYGDGLNIRDWLYVEDHCSAIDLVLHKGVNGEIYNVGGNNERTNIAVVKKILSELNKPETLINYVTDRLGHDRRYAINADKIRRELGWKPMYDYESGISTTVKWYLSNQKWMQRIASGAYRGQ